MRKSFLLTMFFAMAGIFANAQNDLLLNSTWRDTARIYIRQLKEGAIAVRLQTRSKAIEQLNKSGKYQDANNILKLQREENLEIVQAFRTSFKFCKIYFFFADSTDALLNGKRSGYFLNDSLMIDPSIRLTESFFLIAEKGNPHRQSAYDKTQPDVELTEPSYTNETIILSDKNLRLLKDPFPYYAQEPFPANLVSSNWNAKVESLERKLNSFYQKSVK